MTKEEEHTHAAAFHIGQLLEPFLMKDFIAWLEADEARLTRASRVLEILIRDATGALSVRVTDLFRAPNHPDHLSFDEITTAAEERARDEERDRPHVKTCSVCNALIETEAVRIVQRGGPDLSGLEGKTPEAMTDTNPGFGRQPGDRR